MRIRDWSSDVCSSDLANRPCLAGRGFHALGGGYVHGRDLWLQPVPERERGCTVRWPLRPNEIEREAARDGKIEGPDQTDRTSVVEGKRGSVRVDVGGRRIISKNK